MHELGSRRWLRIVDSANKSEILKELEIYL